MAKDAKEIAVTAARIALNPSGYLLDRLVETTAKRVAEAEEDARIELADLRVKAERQQLEMQIAADQARVAQEIAIAKRIETAVEVVMEEYYDYSSNAEIGAKTDRANLSLSAGGNTKKVSKRVFRFSGVIDSVIQSDEEPNK